MKIDSQLFETINEILTSFYCRSLLFKIVDNFLRACRCAEATFLLSFSSRDFEDCFLVSSVMAFGIEN